MILRRTIVVALLAVSACVVSSLASGAASLGAMHPGGLPLGNALGVLAWALVGALLALRGRGGAA